MAAPENFQCDADGKLALDGDGETVEWAVEMQRFDESQTPDRIADSSGIEGVAAMVSSMHSKSPPAARGPDASDANGAIAREQEAYTLGRIEWIEIDASGTPAETLALARTAIR